MVAKSSREAHEAFITGHHGSSALDVILAVYPVIPATVLSLTITRGRVGWLWHIVECIFIVLTLVLSFTAAANHTLELSAALTTVASISLILCKHTTQSAHTESQPIHQQLACLTTCRALVNLATAIAILAVDFHAFPRRFAKTEEYGYSLMDIGAACFVIMNGVVEGRRRVVEISYRRSLQDCGIFFMLGVIRFVTVYLLSYQHHVTEYGVHANFFFTLAFLKISCFWLMSFLGTYSSLLFAIFVGLVHQMVLTGLNWDIWVISDAPRETLLEANREWIVSLPGYVELFVLGASLGMFKFKRSHEGTSLWKPLLTILVIGGITLVAASIYLGAPSRRLANPTFVLWAMFFFVFFLVQSALIEEALRNIIPGHFCSPILFQAINRRPLLFFLLANVVTGIVNLIINTLNISYVTGVVIIAMYSCTLSYIMYFLYYNIDIPIRQKEKKVAEEKRKGNQNKDNKDRRKED